MSRRHLALIFVAIVVLVIGLCLRSPSNDSMQSLPLPPPKSSSQPPVLQVMSADAADTAAAGVVQAQTQGTAQDAVMTAFLDSRVAYFVEKLRLTPDQAAKVRALFLERLPDRPVLLKAAAASADDDESTETLLQAAESMRDFRRPGPFADEIAKLLTGEQKEAWASTLEQMARDDAEITASRELAAIQARFPLSESQKDGIYQVLHEIARREQSLPGVTLEDPEADTRREEAILKGLAPLLTPAQIQPVLDLPEGLFAPLEPLDLFSDDS